MSITVILVLLASAIGVVLNQTEESDGTFSIEGADFIEAGGRIDYTIKTTMEGDVYCTWSLSGGSSSSAYIMDGSRVVTVTASDNPGNYVFTVKFYKDSTKDEFYGERAMPLKVVEPVNITLTLKNNTSTEITFRAYLVVNGERVDEKTITVKGNDDYEYKYEYITKDLRNDNVYKLCSDDENAKKVVHGLNEDRHFYTQQNDYMFFEVALTIIAIVIIFFIVWLARKEVKNFGKPKGRK